MKAIQIKTLRDAFRVFVRHPSPFLLLALLIGFITVRIYLIDHESYPEWNWQASELYGGLIITLYWPFQEWWMHKVLLHLPPLRWGAHHYEASFARIHRLHHESPKYIPLSFLPVSAVLGALVAFCSLFYLLSGRLAHVCTWMAFATTSTIIYEWVHYLTHTDYKPQGKYYRAIWKLHRWHHYKNEQYWFSFTVPWIDRLMGSGPHPRDVPHSPTARDLRGSQRDLQADENVTPNE